MTHPYFMTNFVLCASQVYLLALLAQEPLVNFVRVVLTVTCIVVMFIIAFVNCNEQFILCSGLTYEIYIRGGPSMYVYCMVCYYVTAAPYVRNVVMSLHIITLWMMIRNTQWTMSSLYSLMFFLNKDPVIIFFKDKTNC